MTPERPDLVDRVAIAAQLACLLEASAPKPGNVSPGRHFSDTRYEHFLASAAAIGPAFRQAGERPLGLTVRMAVESTSQWTQSNTNLGIILLMAPIARAAFDCSDAALRDRVDRVLKAATIDDAREVYSAIRRAAPGGLGRAPDQDVAEEPTLPLLDVMKLAMDRDTVAREYATTFDVTFTIGAPALERALADRLSWEDAVLELYLTLLGEIPDTHVIRRAGSARAEEIRRDAARRAAAWRSPLIVRALAIEAMDRRMRDPGNLANPGTTADLTAASIFVVLLGGGWPQARGRE